MAISEMVDDEGLLERIAKAKREEPHEMRLSASTKKFFEDGALAQILDRAAKELAWGDRDAAQRRFREARLLVNSLDPRVYSLPYLEQLVTNRIDAILNPKPAPGTAGGARSASD